MRRKQSSGHCRGCSEGPPDRPALAEGDQPEGGLVVGGTLGLHLVLGPSQVLARPLGLGGYMFFEGEYILEEEEVVEHRSSVVLLR